MNEVLKKIIVIDDDSSNNKLFKIIVSKICKPLAVTITDFTDPQLGVKYMINSYTENPIPTLLFLDINMPVLSGWDVLDKLDVLPDKAKQYLTIFILSSSIDPADKMRAIANPMVNYYLEKPISVNLPLVQKELLEHDNSLVYKKQE